MSDNNPIREKAVSLMTEDIIREEDSNLVDLTGRQMAIALFSAMPDFDLLRNYNLKETFEDPNTTLEVLRPALFIAILQHRLYRWMRDNKHGVPSQLDFMCDSLYVWKNRLHSSVEAKIKNEPRKDGYWLN